MREIKFRAWVDDRFIYTGGTKEWIFINQFGQWEYDTENNSGNSWAVENVTQYTGLHDKNGKEIYEGDIVNFEGLTNYEVKFNKGGFVVDFKNSYKYLGTFANIEIFGNLYEDPELLQ